MDTQEVDTNIIGEAEQMDIDGQQPSPQKWLKMIQLAIENNELEDLYQNTQNESRENGESTKTSKNQNNMTPSSTSTTTSGQDTNTSRFPHNSKIGHPTHGITTTCGKQNRRAGVTVEKDNVISVTQKSYSQVVTGSVSYAHTNDWEDIVKDRKRELRSNQDKEKFDEEKWDYDKIIEAFQNIEQLKELIQHKLTILLTAYPIPDAIRTKMEVMLTNYIDVNYTDKPPLPWDPRKIPEVKIKTPITQAKELTELPKLDQLENNCKIPGNMETIREMIKEVQPETEMTLLITKYEDIKRIVEILKIKFDTSYIPQNLLQLPELDKPEPTNSKDTATKTNIEMADDNAPIMGNHQLTKIKNLKPFECNPAEPLKIMTHNLEIEELAPDDLCTANYSVTGQKFRMIRNTLFMTRKLEIQKSKSESINFYINRRHNNFASNTTKMIDSVLSRHKTAVTYHNLVTPSERNYGRQHGKNNIKVKGLEKTGKN
ncbi:26777_t:CDS:2 [Gigaspora margarita]|uniref:26777_t:CDS:1 n=1 Tax=Gigaspora margarita TaxID=4874 RepID=A0ABM8W3N1_GIGMA|nr:26777_t:CDS:2 [Gigaspora margarita]